MEILEKIEKDQAYSNLQVKQGLSNQQLSQEDSNLVTQLVYGVTQRKLTLDFYLKPYIKKPKKMQSWVIQLLRLSVYQMVYLDRIPDRAVIHEAVEIAKYRGHKGIQSMVNAILRNFQRDDRPNPADISNPIDRLSIQYSAPVWLVQRFVEDYSFEEAEKILASCLEPSKTAIRVNTRWISREEAKNHLEGEGFRVSLSQLSVTNLIVEAGDISQSKLFQSGQITIQDESSALVSQVLNADSGDRILDACAGPGGKTTAIANDLNPDQAGWLEALDIYDHKVSLIQDNIDRQGFSDVAQARLLDAKKAKEVFEKESFDKILVDAPCSGLGLIRRKAEIKYNVNEESIAELQDLQKEILANLLPLLKEGGKLVYSTCTIAREENQAIVAYLNENFPLKQTRISLPESPVRLEEAGEILILPHHYQSDGFFIAEFVKETK